jgi:hypothetical protein
MVKDSGAGGPARQRTAVEIPWFGGVCSDPALRGGGLWFEEARMATAGAVEPGLDTSRLTLHLARIGGTATDAVQVAACARARVAARLTGGASDRRQIASGQIHVESDR